MKKIINYTFFLSVLIIISCEKEQFLGPPLESLYGELQVTKGERLDRFHQFFNFPSIWCRLVNE